MIRVTIKRDSFNKLAREVRKAGRKIPNETAATLNKVANQMKTPISQEIRKILAVKAAPLKKLIYRSKKATRSSFKAVTSLDRSERMSLKEFRPRQTKKGVTYKIDKKKKRKLATGAFMGPKPGVMAIRLYGHVFRRKNYPGQKTALPIVKLKGPSPWGVYERYSLVDLMAVEAEERLEKEMKRRIQYNIVKPLSKKQPKAPKA